MERYCHKEYKCEVIQSPIYYDSIVMANVKDFQI